jgi:hypothetical protein
VLEAIEARHGADLVFTYSRYQVAQPGLQAAAPRSPVLRVPVCEVTADWLIDRLSELGPNEELAWHSLVECKGVGFHIPMIDFVSRPSPSVLYDLGRRLAAELGLSSHLMLFETGQSFHGYFPDLIRASDWPRYLGHLLLLNEYDCPPVIDARWVAHSLVRGFSGLRWSQNTTRYRAMPRLTSVLELGGL